MGQKYRISAPWMRVRIAVVAALATAALAALSVGSASAASTAPAARAACGGRALLTCDEKNQSFPDAVNWSHAFVLDGELFETPLASHIHTAALKQFWLFETATAAARAEYEFGLASEIADSNFETVVQPPVLPAPVVHRGRVVDRRLAGQLTALMQAEQAEVLNLYALGVSMNRATEARYERGRDDWLRWQEAVAAGYARRTSAAIVRVIRAERQVSRSLIKRKLLFGVGSADLNVARRTVRRHGLDHSLVALLHSFGFDSSLVSHSADFFRGTNFGTLSFSLSQFFAQPSVFAAENEFRGALNHFAARIPAAQRPPS
jgi:hypothetical protein